MSKLTYEQPCLPASSYAPSPSTRNPYLYPLPTLFFPHLPHGMKRGVVTPGTFHQSAKSSPRCLSIGRSSPRAVKCFGSDHPQTHLEMPSLKDVSTPSTAVKASRISCCWRGALGVTAPLSATNGNSHRVGGSSAMYATFQIGKRSQWSLVNTKGYIDHLILTHAALQSHSATMVTWECLAAPYPLFPADNARTWISTSAHMAALPCPSLEPN